MDKPDYLDRIDEFHQMLVDKGFTQADIDQIGIDALLLVRFGDNSREAYLNALYQIAVRDLN